MKNLSEITQNSRSYLKNKWTVSNAELERDIRRTTDRLNNRVERQTINEQEIEDVQKQVEDAESVLTHLTNTGAPQEMIDRQQESVNNLNDKLQDALYSGGSLTDEEVILQQGDIDVLKLTKQYQEGKIAEIEAIEATLNAVTT